MALASNPGDTQRPRPSTPPPTPVQLRLEAEPWERLPKELVLDLRLRLTNHECRGDVKDDGVGAGSLMRELIDDYNMGVTSAFGWWAITVWPEGSRFRGPIAWCLLRPVADLLPTMRLAFYTAPEWRKRGVGHLLVNEAQRLARQLGYERLQVLPWNVSSRSFFRGNCFQPIVQSVTPMSEMDVPQAPPARLPWRCRPPEAP